MGASNGVSLDSERINKGVSNDTPGVFNDTSGAPFNAPVVMGVVVIVVVVLVVTGVGDLHGSLVGVRGMLDKDRDCNIGVSLFGLGKGEGGTGDWNGEGELGDKGKTCSSS